ncbi:Major Facilitator Superfamily protein [Chryseolinea serpens]|uniref:Major Facilitator Superfamily protein n=1 Tax=Chryseolinea serpens TaxID=947013 RepID=A0A1M5M2T3_9BACT|nr:MFS transporter [Chryseolinea serpens]SHG71607.1 Major Facilitator Superfamily protein [Chryseolinea serpens]
MKDLSDKSTFQHLTSIPVLVASLGYLVDMYDLFLYNIVRVPSLKSLGLADDQLVKIGIGLLLNLQMAGMLIGGIFWGILGDKKGRLSVLFGSILIYSLANICNGLVTSVQGYAILRFLAGFGLAGELGVGVTLVVEILPKSIRGYGTTLVATMGVFGALLAFSIVHFFEWRVSYFIGGGLGLMLMVLRLRVFESGIFIKLKEANTRRGDLGLLVSNKTRILKYVTCIVMGAPIWFVVGILITLAPELGKAMQLGEPVDAGKAVLFVFAAQVAGNLVSGFFSQYLQSRKKVIFIFMAGSLLFALTLLLGPIEHATEYYILCLCLGFCSGYWTLFITVAAELFGSNLRATVATTVPNFVRATIIPLSSLFIFLKGYLVDNMNADINTGTLRAALITGLITYALGMVALLYLEETFKKDMNYIEEN